jgi:hypothetical protein
MEHSPAYSDTDPKAREVWLESLRQKTPGEKLAMVFEMNEMGMRLARAGVRLRHPLASDREVFLRAAAIRLGRDLIIRAYGWDPDEHDGG